MTTEEKYRLATQLMDTAAELARLGAMCCSNDPRTELERMALKWLKAAAWMKNKADELKGVPGGGKRIPYPARSSSGGPDRRQGREAGGHAH
jgi:hypothetical protein